MRVMMCALTSVFIALAPAAAAETVAINLSGAIDGRGLSLSESDKPVHRIHLTAQVDKNGEGKGTLVLDRTAPSFDEFGFPAAAAAVPAVKLECSLKFVK